MLAQMRAFHALALARASPKTRACRKLRRNVAVDGASVLQCALEAWIICTVACLCTFRRGWKALAVVRLCVLKDKIEFDFRTTFSIAGRFGLMVFRTLRDGVVHLGFDFFFLWFVAMCSILKLVSVCVCWQFGQYTTHARNMYVFALPTFKTNCDWFCLLNWRLFDLKFQCRIVWVGL